MDTLFSIITITFNAESTLPPTLKSVAEQTFTDFEYLVIDGASKDRTVELVRQSGIANLNCLSEPDKGLYDAMNKGLARAQGRYVIFLNAGDSFHSSETLSQIAHAITANSYPGVVYGQTDLVDAHRQRVGQRHLTAPDVLTWQSFKDGMLVCHQAFVARRDITGPYDMSYRFSADFDWCIKVLKKSDSNIYIPNVLIDYLSEGVTTANRRASLRERYDIMCRYYGTLPTMLRHIKFFIRNLLR